MRKNKFSLLDEENLIDPPIVKNIKKNTKLTPEERMNKYVDKVINDKNTLMLMDDWILITVHTTKIVFSYLKYCTQHSDITDYLGKTPNTSFDFDEHPNKQYVFDVILKLRNIFPKRIIASTKWLQNEQKIQPINVLKCLCTGEENIMHDTFALNLGNFKETNHIIVSIIDIYITHTYASVYKNGLYADTYELSKEFPWKQQIVVNIHRSNTYIDNNCPDDEVVQQIFDIIKKIHNNIIIKLDIQKSLPNALIKRIKQFTNQTFQLVDLVKN